MQRTLVNKLYTLLEGNKDVVYLTADNGTDYDVLLFSSFPGQCRNMGIAEENMVAAAAGMAMCGKIPLVCSSGAFLAYRAYEFIRNDVCFQNQNVKLLALGSGMSISALGPTHHTTEDISALRAIPGLTILSVSTPLELEAALCYAVEVQGPVYLRMGMRAYGEYHEDAAGICPKGVSLLRSGKDALVFATGDMVHNVMAAAELLSRDHQVEVSVANVLGIKPLDKEAVLCLCGQHSHVFTAEEHNVIGGLGDLILCAVQEAGQAVPVHKMGIKDQFASGYGSQPQIQAYNGLGAEAICQRVLQEVRP